jgi:uridine kinase
MSHVIAVAGHPGAGKSAVVQGLVQALGDASAIHMDSYETITFKPIGEIAQWMKDGADIDAFTFPQLEQDLQRLLQGATIVEPRTGQEVLPRKYILFETQFGKAHRATGRHVDLLIWIDTPLDIALARVIRALTASFLREHDAQMLAQRVQWLQNYLDNYLGTVRALMAMQKQKVAALADVVIDGQGPLPDVVQSARREILRRLP